MKKLLIIISLLLIINNVKGYSILQVSNQEYNMLPGENGIIKLSLTNAGTDIAYNTRIALINLTTPLTSSELCNACKEFSTSRNICTEYEDYCYKKVGDIYGLNSQDAVFSINIPSNATGYHIATFSIKYESFNLTTHETITRFIDKKIAFNIESINNKPSIVIKSIKMPNKISPAQRFNISLIAENNGNEKANNVIIELRNNYIKTISNTTNISVGDINPNEEKVIKYSLIADPSLTPGTYDLTINAYYSSNNNNYKTTNTAGLLVDGDCSFNVFIQGINPTIIKENNSISVLVSIANTGLINAKAVSIKINPSEGIELSNVKEDFLGDLDSGDFTTTSFDIKPLKEGKALINLTLTYLTPSGDKNEFNVINPIIIRFNKEVKSEPINYSLIITLIIIGITIYLIKIRK